jgi:putative FmdB family regulatory protein
MPTYEYECTSCGHRVEVFQRLADKPLTTCEVCGGKLRKLFHPVGISFKGSGFYVTDSRAGSSKPSKGTGGEKKPSTKGSGSSSEGGTKSATS